MHVITPIAAHVPGKLQPNTKPTPTARARKVEIVDFTTLRDLIPRIRLNITGGLFLPAFHFTHNNPWTGST